MHPEKRRLTETTRISLTIRISVTEFITDGKKNILPGKGLIKGDARALSEDSNIIIEQSMRQIVKGICEAYNVSYEVSYKTTCPMTFNESKQAESATKACLLNTSDAADE